MRTELPGTDHTSTFNRREKAILEAVQCTPSIKKLKTGRMVRTGPTKQQRLQLRPMALAGTTKQLIEGWLFIGSGKRRLKLYPQPCISLEALRHELAARLERYGVTVEVRENSQREAEQEDTLRVIAQTASLSPPARKDHAMQFPENGQKPFLMTDDTWPYFELIAEHVKKFKLLQQEEDTLQAQLEQLHHQKQQVQKNVLEAFTQVLESFSTPSA
jgi:hypothetical protein